MSSYSDSELSDSGCSMIVGPACPSFKGAGGGFRIGCGTRSDLFWLENDGSLAARVVKLESAKEFRLPLDNSCRKSGC